MLTYDLLRDVFAPRSSRIPFVRLAYKIWSYGL